MDIKKILVLLIFAIAIVGIVAPINAALECQVTTDDKKPNKGKNNVFVFVTSDIGLYDDDGHTKKYKSKRKKELNNINKIVLSIKGHKTTTLKKPAKGWKVDYACESFSKELSLKGSAVYKKNYSIKFYDKNNKLLKTKVLYKSKVQLQG